MPNPNSREDDAIIERLDSIAIRLDLIVNLLLDLLPEDKFAAPRRLTHKVARLDSTGIPLRPADIGKILGRPSKDISSRRREYQRTSPRKKTNEGKP